MTAARTSAGAKAVSGLAASLSTDSLCHHLARSR